MGAFRKSSQPATKRIDICICTAKPHLRCYVPTRDTLSTHLRQR